MAVQPPRLQAMAILHSVFAKQLDIQLAALIKKSTGKTIRPQLKTWPNKSVLEIFLIDPLTISKTIDDGLTVEFFDTAFNYAPFTKEEWASILDLSFKTITRHRIEIKPLPAQASEKIIQLLEITSLGLAAFGTIENFRHWLDTPNKKFKKIKPADPSIKPVNMLKNAYGHQLILTQLKSLNN